MSDEKKPSEVLPHAEGKEEIPKERGNDENHTRWGISMAAGAEFIPERVQASNTSSEHSNTKVVTQDDLPQVTGFCVLCEQAAKERDELNEQNKFLQQNYAEAKDNQKVLQAKYDRLLAEADALRAAIGDYHIERWDTFRKTLEAK